MTAGRWTALGSLGFRENYPSQEASEALLDEMLS